MDTQRIWPFLRTVGAGALMLASVQSAAAIAGPSPQLATSSVAATVLDACRVDGAIGPVGWNLNFGTYRLETAASVNFGTVLYCTKGTIVNSVTLDNGLHYLSASRNMSDGAAHSLPYKIYTTTCGAGLIEWSGANSPSAFQGVTSTSVRTSIGGSECGTIDTGINVPAGAYSDTITLTVNYT